MIKLTRWATALLAVIVLAPNALPSKAFAEDQDVIDYRQHIMKALDAQTAAVGQILSFSIPEDQLPSHLETIAITAKTALKSFEQNVPGGEALPAVWENWGDFTARMNDFVDRMEKAAEHAKTGGREAIMGEIVLALSCKSCHDIYREKNSKQFSCAGLSPKGHGLSPLE